MVKSLLLASAAGLAAISAAQAADAPVKARPVVNMSRICSLYGEGFFYIPGTDTCLKIGGFLRVQAEMGAGSGGIVVGSQPMADVGRFTRDLTNDMNYRVRAVISWDVRQQTEYGTLRTYLRAGWRTRRRRDRGRHYGDPILGSCLHPVRRLHGRPRAVVLRCVEPQRHDDLHKHPHLG